MKSVLIGMLVVLASGSVFAEQKFDFTKRPKDEAERQARKEYLAKRNEVRFGGKIMRPDTQKGEIVYVNCQKKAPRALIDDSVAYFTEVTKFSIRVADGEFDLQNPKIQGSATLFVVDDAKLPSLLAAPEDRWAVVNVSKLDEGGKQAFFDARVKKELTRGFSLLCGAMNSGYDAAVVGPVTATTDLDQFMDAQLPADVIGRFERYMGPFGVTPAIYTTYRTACKEGWAPSPTNDVQKQVAELVRKEKEETLTAPSKPRKIVFDPAKGE